MLQQLFENSYACVHYLPPITSGGYTQNEFKSKKEQLYQRTMKLYGYGCTFEINRTVVETGSKSGIQAQQEKRIRLVLGRLNASCEPKDMNLPGLRLHALHGNLNGFWAVDVTGNWRIIFRFEGTNVFDVDLIDYH